MGGVLSVEDRTDLERRVLHIEREVGEMRVQAAEQRAALREQVAALDVKVDVVSNMATATKADTGEIVALLKGMKLLGALTKWVGIPGGIGGVFYAFGSLKGWWK